MAWNPSLVSLVGANTMQAGSPTTTYPLQPLFPRPIESAPCMKHTAHQTDDRPSGDGYWLSKTARLR